MQTAPAHLAPNVWMPMHPIIRAKLSQLRDVNTNSRDVKGLIHDITLFLAYEALRGSLTSTMQNEPGTTPTGNQYTVHTVDTKNIAIVPILRSGLTMVDAIQQVLPGPATVHHLGFTRPSQSAYAVQYYSAMKNQRGLDGVAMAADLAIVCDPQISSGRAISAVITVLKKWGVKKIVVISVLGAAMGIDKVNMAWPEGCEVWIAGVDHAIGEDGSAKPGIGNIGERIFGTNGI